MFEFINRKKFLKSLQPGQIVRHQGLLSNTVVLFEFGHYDESEDKVYWQTARVLLGHKPEEDTLTNTASVQFDGKIFEQVADYYIDGYSLASEKEIRRFEEVYDKFITGLYCEGKMSKVYVRPNHDERLTRLQLAVEPPVFLYIKSDAAGECIFKAAPLTMTNDSWLNAENCFMLNAKEMVLINDKIELIPEGETRNLGSYDNIVIREATDTERKLLLIQSKEALKEGYVNDDEINILKKEHAKWLHQQQEEEQKKTTQTKTKKRDIEPRFRPFISKILVSNGKDDVWRPAIFGCISESFQRYMIVGGQQYKYCIPYRGNQHLIGKKFNSSDMP